MSKKPGMGSATNGGTSIEDLRQTGYEEGAVQSDEVGRAESKRGKRTLPLSRNFVSLVSLCLTISA